MRPFRGDDMRGLSLLALSAVPAVYLGACTAVPNGGPVGQTISMALTGDGTNVTLSGSPNDATFVGVYPVANVTQMTITITEVGDIIALCQTATGTAPCVEHPFFTSVQRQNGVNYIKVFDVFGTKVADTAMCEPDGDAGNCDMPDGGDNGGDPPEYPPTPDSGSGGGSGGGGGGCGTDGGGSGGDSGSGGDDAGSNSDDGGGVGDTPHCDAAAVAAAQQQFCNEVDQWLMQHNINYTLNCSLLNGHFDYSHAYPPEVHDDIACLEEIEQAWIDVDAELSACGPDVQTTIINWKSSSRWDLIQHGTCRGSPLVLDLDGDGINLSSLDEGVAFGLFGGGAKVKSSWIASGDGWLVLDRNGNGEIDDATELFGNVSGNVDHADGFQALGELDANGDGLVDVRDPGFVTLRVWRDMNADGKSSPAELVTVADLGIRALVVAATRVKESRSWDIYGNQIPLIGSFIWTDGSKGMVADAYLRFEPLLAKSTP
jgi:hypothetical protein